MKTQKAQWIAENLKPGEHYAGIILGKNGDPDHHVILLPAKDDKSMNWKTAQDMAKKAGGVLPSRREQSLLFANCKEEFKPDWYWSGEEYAQTTAAAWCQNFNYGIQGLIYKDGSYCRARAVRRLVIE
jgi:hypothetical protein